ncbi:hypothetical protein CSC17_0052 [Klebsiella oxytoca]|nr:hypothetical protein CSC17_0052 [Klebsiella oxytoca]
MDYRQGVSEAIRLCEFPMVGISKIITHLFAGLFFGPVSLAGNK